MQFLGTTDEVTSCDCCGRADLKSTIAIEKEDGTIVYYGTTCGARALKVPVKEFKSEAKKADDAREAALLEIQNAHEAARALAWDAHLIALTGGRYDFSGKPDRFAMIQSLGGMAAAKIGFTFPELA